MAVVDTAVREPLHAEIESPTAKLVYLSLVHDGPATVGELQERLGEQRLTLLGVLGSLADRGLVAVDREAGEATYDVAE